MIALSTCWQSPLAKSGKDLMQNVRALGFSEIELEYKTTFEMFSKTKASLRSLGIRPVSLHDYFPAPGVVTQQREENGTFSSADPDKRKNAVDYTRKAINLAGELGAKALVVHCGQVTIDPCFRQLREIFDAGQISAPAGRQLINSIRKDRELTIDKTLDRVRECLDSLLGTAERARVKIGLENRYHAHEIPNSQDLAKLLPSLPSSWLGYWHDVGHAAVQENLGLDSQTALLGLFRDRTIGVHLHDAQGYTDHLSPGTGEVDFVFVKENLPTDIIQVLEVQPSITVDQMRAGLGHLAKAGIH